MAHITADRVKETTRTVGTGSISLDGASIGYRAFENVCSNNDTCYYCVISQTGSQWEVGLATFITVNTLQRTTVNASSNAGGLVDFSAGTKDIFLALTATQFSANTLPAQTGNSGKFLTTNGTTGVWTSTLPVANGGTGTTDGSITGTGALTIAAGGSNEAVTVSPSGTGDVLINRMRINNYTHPSAQLGIITTLQRESLVASGYPGTINIIGANATANGSGGSVSIFPGTKAGSGSDGKVNIDGVSIKGVGSNLGTVRIGNTSNNDSYSVAVGYFAGDNNSVTGNSEARSIFIGYFAGKYQSDGATPTTNTANSIYIGESARSSGNSDNNTIVIGSNCAGEGTNTTVIGNTSTTYTKLHGYTKSKSLQETVFAITDGSSVDINPANGGIQTWTLGANRTPTASSFAEGQSVTLMIDDGTAYAITWSTISPTWVGGTAPTLATSGYTVIELWKRSTTIYGALVGTA